MGERCGSGGSFWFWKIFLVMKDLSGHEGSLWSWRSVVWFHCVLWMAEKTINQLDLTEGVITDYVQ